MTAATATRSQLVPATRISTLAKVLDDGYGLRAYIAATTLQEVGSRATLRNRLALMDPSEGWRAYKALHEEAQQLRGSPEADEGTNVHMAVGALVAKRDLSGLDSTVLADAQAVLDILDGYDLEPVAVEEFGVVVAALPELVAGTRDLVVRAKASGKHYVVDIKTTNELGKGAKFSGVSWAMQVALYARCGSYPYPFTRDRWDRPRVDLLKVGKPVWPVETGMGVVVEVERFSGRAELHRLDLDMGMRYASLACQVRAARNSNPFL